MYFSSANVLVDHCQNFLCMAGNVNNMQSPRRDAKAREGVLKGGQGLILQAEDRSMKIEAQGQEMREERWKGKRVGQEMEKGGRVWKGRKLGFQVRCLVRSSSAITRPKLGMTS